MKFSLGRFSNIAKSMRNVGIIAHVDAGKTTTTERILYDAGKIKFVGEVDKGNTVTDYLDQERERGITITNATASIKWKAHNINIIDTPGHVDFTLEVERALTVLDGSITILDSVKGVEAQTQTVWNQSKHHKIPNLFYINKFDRKNSNLNFCLKSIKNKLPSIVPLLIHLPYYSEVTGDFSGILDIVDLKLYEWLALDKSSKDILTEYQTRKISDAELIFKTCIECRLKLLEALVNMDDGIIRNEFLLLEDPASLIPAKMIHDTLRKVTLSALGSPVLLGSSRMNIGVTNLLDKIVDYLPNPSEKKIPHHFAPLACHPDHVSALAFKVVHNSYRGPMTFLRLYSGFLKPNMFLKNLTRSVVEKVDKIVQMTGDQFTELEYCFSGNIVAVSGLKNCFTGDVLVDTSMPHISDHETYADLIPIPDPVIFASIEAYSISEIKALENALGELTKEDSSLSFHRDEDTNQLVVGGMGNLHLEVILDRIRKDYKLPKTTLGKLKIIYKECPTEDSIFPLQYDHIQCGKINGNDVQMSISLSVTNLPSYNDNSDIHFINSKEFSWNVINPKISKIIKTSLQTAIQRGGSMLKSPLVGTKIMVHKFTVEPSHVSLLYKSCHPLLRSCVSEGAQNLFKMIKTDLLEPLMNVEILLCLPDTVAHDYIQKIQSDLHKRRSNIISVSSSSDGPYPDLIKTYVPLSETLDYSNTIRSLTSGHASLHISFSHYDRMTKEAQDSVTMRKMYRSPYK